VQKKEIAFRLSQWVICPSDISFQFLLQIRHTLNYDISENHGKLDLPHTFHDYVEDVSLKSH
jgi:hypothetical protein